MIRTIFAAAMLATTVRACLPESPAEPAASDCGFASETIAGFVAADTGAGVPGRSRQVEGGFELCSATQGFGATSDEHHHVSRSADGDFVLVASIDASTEGEVSVGFARNAQDDRGPRVRASLRRTSTGASLRVGVRAAAHAEETVLVEEPLDRIDRVVRLARENAVISVGLDDPMAPDGFVTVATVPTLGTPLEAAGDVLLAQASGTSGAVAHAVFRRVTLQSDGAVAEPACTAAVAAQAGETMTVVGRHLAHVDRVFVDGEAVPVASSAAQRVSFVMPTFPSDGVRSLALESRGRRFELRRPVLVQGASTAPPPPGPALEGVVDVTGATRGALAGEDDVFLVVSNPPRLEGLRVYLGDVEAELLDDSVPSKLHVRLPAIPYDHLGCPRLFVPASHEGPPSAVRFGDVYGVDPAQHPDLCPMLDSASDRVQEPPRLVATTALDEALLAPDVALRVRALWSESTEARATRGSRLVEVEVLPPTVPAGGDLRAATLAKIVATLNEHLQGGEPGCGCDVVATSDPAAGTLSFAPCTSSPGPLPPIPPWPSSFVPNVPVWSHLDIQASVGLPPEPADCATVVRDEDPRAWGWCQFRAVVRTLESGPLAGYPRFESFTPVASVLEAHAALNLEAQGLVRPEDRHAQAETTVVEPGMAERLVALGYADPRGYAARASYCTEHEVEQTWMPRFRTGDRILKLMWVDATRLGAGMNPARLYSYQPASGPRQYLVGMHIGVARFLDHGDYFDWITYWVPPTSDPPSHFNTHCPTGSNADKPLDFYPSAWGDFVMCVETGGARCGNPWAVLSECNVEATVGCANCHEAQGRFLFDDDGTSRHLEVAWLPGLRTQQEAFATALTEIADGADYQDLVDCAASDPSQQVDPFLE